MSQHQPDDTAVDSRDGIGLVVHSRRPGVDAIDQYSRLLVESLGARGHQVEYVPGGTGALLDRSQAPAWVFLQYNPFSYGRSGIAPGLLRDVELMRRRWAVRFLVMVHEAWIDITDPKSALVGLWQRAQLRTLLRSADAVLASTETLARRLGPGAIHVPIATTIQPVGIDPSVARDALGVADKFVVTSFGRGNPSRAIGHAEAAIAAIVAARGAPAVAVLNLGADAPELQVPEGVDVLAPGRLSERDLSIHLRASDLVLLPFTDGVSTRRSTLMAALAHGTPVLATQGHNTDAVLVNSPSAVALTHNSRSAFSAAAATLSSDRRRLRELGAAGAALYESEFAWPVLADRIAKTLRTTMRPAARRIVFVAHDVGGGGGMERQSERLVTGLLDAGQAVDVVARTCSIEPRPGLRFRRVRTPARPFSLGYPAFFAAASALSGRGAGVVVHTTGAIVARRADIATVHYCHHAAQQVVTGSRASKPGPLFSVNATVAAQLSRVAEAWCYRPARTRMLCAVSTGVADELAQAFPPMRSAIRTIANGVDATRFRPDVEARTSARAELGIDAATPVALFAGGDWERKGLTFAIDALAIAGAWHLVVAGPGDPAAPTERAEVAATGSRLHLLGRVDDMPRWYAAADAFVLPTSYEAFPLVVLEAAAAGLPLLVPRVNGVEDLLTDGANGWFITRDSTVIARRLLELGSDAERSRRMGQEARRAAEQFSWERMVDGYLSLYSDLARAT